MNSNEFFNNNFFKNDPSELFKDIGKQVYNQFSSSAFPTNIYDTDDAYIVEAELPGVSKEDISLKFEQNILLIKANKKLKNESQKIQLNERSTGELERHFKFDDINKEEIIANHAEGVLYVTLPKVIDEDEKATTIAIQ
ncbi:Hsp20 family protein [Staphylococcus caprae]|uniref:Hsp20/alpha crystallin family protein n=1 Tax=Staphylococcus caprae TaxID=29380 RepID=UPI00254BF60F|nr:Hsp20 family protein [Staphylococcus caprae]MDK6297932.1 Hsp20 family protein [Staphylococcus caprae]MDK7233551.1 Hsp20 family protein [Staphylococcus caprae]